MTKDVVSVAPATPFEEVAGLLLRHDVSGLPVVDDDGGLVGIVTEADLMGREAYDGGRRRRPMELLVDVLTGDSRWVEKARGLTASELMTPHPFCIGPGHDVDFAARRMLEHRVKRLPVVDRDNRLVGILSRHDVLRVFERPGDR